MKMVLKILYIIRDWLEMVILILVYVKIRDVITVYFIRLHEGQEIWWDEDDLFKNYLNLSYTSYIFNI